MKTNTTAPSYKGFRFPPEIISHTVWLYFRFSLSFRSGRRASGPARSRGNVCARCESACLKFGQMSANELRRRRPKTGDTWHMDEVYLKINGKTHYVWRAVDQYGNVLDILVQSRRNKYAAKEFFRKLLKGLQYVPRVIFSLSFWTHCWSFPATQAPLVQKANIVPFYRADSWNGTR